jgi:hypothetical protein
MSLRIWTFLFVGAAFAFGEPASVQKAVEQLRMVRMAEITANRDNAVALFSPNRTWVALVTKRAVVRENLNLYSILFYRVDELARDLGSAHSSIPKPQQQLEIRVTRDDGGIADLRWTTETELTFIAQGDNGRRQGFVVGPTSSEQITHAETDIAAFDVSDDIVAYYETLPPTEPDAITVVDQQTLISVLFPGPEFSYQPLQLKVQRRREGLVTNIGGPVLLSTPKLWLSPDGRYLVTERPAASAPTSWADYAVVRPEYRWTPEAVVSDPLSPKLLFRRRFFLANLERGSFEPLLDAPAGTLSPYRIPAAAIWPEPDRLILCGTYLPLTGEGGSDNKNGASVAEIDLTSRAVSSLLAQTSIRARDIFRVYPVPGKPAVVVQTKTPHGEQSFQFERENGAWILSQPSLKAERVSIALQESFQSSPQLIARSAAGQEKVLLKLSSPSGGGQSRRELFTWVDQNQRTWKGGLLRPSGFQAGYRYPLIVQTHGFSERQYLVDGPAADIGTAFAAEALAASGFLVLQVQDDTAATMTGDEREAALTAEGYRAAIVKLCDQGLADPDRVGLVAFSRTGLAAIRLIADNPSLLHAVVLADGSWWSYLTDLLLLHSPPEQLTQVRKLSTGESLRSDDPASWFNANPFYGIARSCAAFRIEATGLPSALAHWEHLAILERAHCPVEMVLYRTGSHNLQRPAERFASQQGTVDWFAFWLKGEERSQPNSDAGETEDKLKAQYKRWSGLRKRN